MATHEVDKPNETRTITSLKPEGVDEIGKQLRSLLADVFALYLKTRTHPGDEPLSDGWYQG